jgi:hypothetical protein
MRNGWDNRQLKGEDMFMSNGWKLVSKVTGEPVNKGDEILDFRGNESVLRGGQPPQHPGSTGRVTDTEGNHVYPSVYSLKWVRMSEYCDCDKCNRGKNNMKTSVDNQLIDIADQIIDIVDTVADVDLIENKEVRDAETDVIDSLHNLRHCVARARDVPSDNAEPELRGRTEFERRMMGEIMAWSITYKKPLLDTSEMVKLYWKEVFGLDMGDSK